MILSLPFLKTEISSFKNNQKTKLPCLQFSIKKISTQMGIRIIERLKLKRTHFKIAHSILAFLLLRIRFMDISILFFQARRQSEGREIAPSNQMFRTFPMRPMIKLVTVGKTLNVRSEITPQSSVLKSS